MATISVSDNSFESDVINSDVPVLVDFWAEWCAPCKRLAPALEAVSEEFDGRLKVAKMNIDDEPDTPGKFHIRSIPTMMIFKNGEVVSTKAGDMSKGKLAEWLGEHV